MTVVDVLSPKAATMLRHLGVDASSGGLYDDTGSELYHRLSELDRSEIPELLQELRGEPRRVLELAAGSGRLSLPLASAGHEVLATDNSQDMLRFLEAGRSRLSVAARERLSWAVADMETFDLDDRFDTVLIATTSISLVAPEALAEVFNRVRRHLCDGGTLLLGLEAPGAAQEARSENFQIDFDDGTAHLFTEYESGNTHRLVTGVWVASDGSVSVSTSRPAVHRWDHVLSTLDDCGFVLDGWQPVRSMGDYGTRMVRLVVER